MQEVEQGPCEGAGPRARPIKPQRRRHRGRHGLGWEEAAAEEAGARAGHGGCGREREGAPVTEP